MEALKRIRANTIEKRLRNKNGDPNFNVNFYVVNARESMRASRSMGERRRARLAGAKGRQVRFASATRKARDRFPSRVCCRARPAARRGGLVPSSA